MHKFKQFRAHIILIKSLRLDFIYKK